MKKTLFLLICISSLPVLTNPEQPNTPTETNFIKTFNDLMSTAQGSTPVTYAKNHPYLASLAFYLLSVGTSKITAELYPKIPGAVKFGVKEIKKFRNTYPNLTLKKPIDGIISTTQSLLSYPYKALKVGASLAGLGIVSAEFQKICSKALGLKDDNMMFFTTAFGFFAPSLLKQLFPDEAQALVNNKIEQASIEIIEPENLKPYTVYNDAFEKNLSELKNQSTMLIHGPTGTGKSNTIAAIAKRLNKKLVLIHTSDVASIYKDGVTTLLNIIKKKIKKGEFDDCIIAFEEFESLVSDREKNASAHEDKTTVGFMNILEIIPQHNMLLIATTNHKNKIDPASLGRLKVDYYYGPANTQEREAIINNFFQTEKLNIAQMDLKRIKEDLIKYSENFENKRTQALCKNVAQYITTQQNHHEQFSLSETQTKKEFYDFLYNLIIDKQNEAEQATKNDYITLQNNLTGYNKKLIELKKTKQIQTNGQNTIIEKLLKDKEIQNDFAINAENVQKEIEKINNIKKPLNTNKKKILNNFEILKDSFEIIKTADKDIISLKKTIKKTEEKIKNNASSIEKIKQLQKEILLKKDPCDDIINAINEYNKQQKTGENEEFYKRLTKQAPAIIKELEKRKKLAKTKLKNDLKKLNQNYIFTQLFSETNEYKTINTEIEQKNNEKQKTISELIQQRDVSQNKFLWNICQTTIVQKDNEYKLAIEQLENKLAIAFKKYYSDAQNQKTIKNKIDKLKEEQKSKESKFTFTKKEQEKINAIESNIKALKEFINANNILNSSQKITELKINLKPLNTIKKSNKKIDLNETTFIQKKQIFTSQETPEPTTSWLDYLSPTSWHESLFGKPFAPNIDWAHNLLKNRYNITCAKERNTLIQAMKDLYQTKIKNQQSTEYRKIWNTIYNEQTDEMLQKKNITRSLKNCYYINDNELKQHTDKIWKLYLYKTTIETEDYKKQTPEQQAKMTWQNIFNTYVGTLLAQKVYNDFGIKKDFDIKTLTAKDGRLLLPLDDDAQKTITNDALKTKLGTINMKYHTETPSEYLLNNNQVNLIRYSKMNREKNEQQIVVKN